MLASASSTLEELYLLGRLARGLGSANIDHRLRQRDFRDQVADPLFPQPGTAHRGRRAPERAAGHRLQPAARGADPRAPRAQGGAQGREGRVAESGALPVPVPGRGRHDVAHRPSRSPISPRFWPRPRRPRASRRSGAPRGRRERRAASTDAHRAAGRRRSLAGERRARVARRARGCAIRRYADLRALAAALPSVTGATLGVARRGRQRRRRLSRGLRARIARRAASRSRSPGSTRATCWHGRSRPTCCSAASSPGSTRSTPEACARSRKAELVVAVTPFASEQLKRDRARAAADRAPSPRPRAPT